MFVVVVVVVLVVVVVVLLVVVLMAVVVLVVMVVMAAAAAAAAVEAALAVVVAIVLPADILHFFIFKFMNKNVLTFCLVNAGDGHFAVSSLGSDNDENFLFSPDLRLYTDSCL